MRDPPDPGLAVNVYTVRARVRALPNSAAREQLRCVFMPELEVSVHVRGVH